MVGEKKGHGMGKGLEVSIIVDINTEAMT